MLFDKFYFSLTYLVEVYNKKKNLPACYFIFLKFSGNVSSSAGQSNSDQLEFLSCRKHAKYDHSFTHTSLVYWIITFVYLLLIVYLCLSILISYFLFFRFKAQKINQRYENYFQFFYWQGKNHFLVSFKYIWTYIDMKNVRKKNTKIFLIYDFTIDYYCFVLEYFQFSVVIQQSCVQEHIFVFQKICKFIKNLELL